MATFSTSIKLLAANAEDYLKLLKEMERKLFYPSNEPIIIGYQSELCQILFETSSINSLFEATRAVSEALSIIGKKFSFTIMKVKY